MNMTLKQAAAKALAELQQMPDWHTLDEKLQQVDPWGTNEALILQGVREKLAHTARRPMEVVSADSGEDGERSPYLVRALLYLINDLRVPAAIWNRERDGRRFAELVVYQG